MTQNNDRDFAPNLTEKIELGIISRFVKNLTTIKNPDNMILSIALKYKNQNPILITSDNGLQLKAKGMRINTLTLYDFLHSNK